MTGLGRALSGRLSGFSTGGLGSSQEVPLWARRLGAPAHAIRAFDWTAADRYWNTSLKGFSRGSDGWQRNAAGVWVRSDPGVLRRADGVGALWEVASTNYVQGSRNVGGSVGLVGSGGVAPLNKGYTRPGGVSFEVQSITPMDGGAWYLHRLRIFGTSNGSTNVVRVLSHPQTYGMQIPAVAGETFTARGVARVVEFPAGPSAMRFMLTGMNSSASSIENATTPFVMSPTANLVEVSSTHTFVNGSVVECASRFEVASMNNGVAIDLTFEFGWWSIEKRSSPTSWIDTASAASATRAADAGALAAAGLANWTIVFDNGSLQTFSGISGDLSIVPANLNRSTIKGGWAVAA